MFLKVNLMMKTIEYHLPSNISIKVKEIYTNKRNKNLKHISYDSSSDSQDSSTDSNGSTKSAEKFNYLMIELSERRKRNLKCHKLNNILLKDKL